MGNLVGAEIRRYWVNKMLNPVILISKLSTAGNWTSGRGAPGGKRGSRGGA